MCPATCRLPLGSLLFKCVGSRGIHIWEGRPGFISPAHTDEDLARVVDALGETLIERQRAGFLPLGEDAPPVPGARRGTRPDGREGWFVSDPDRPGRYLEVSIA